MVWVGGSVPSDCMRGGVWGRLILFHDRRFHVGTGPLDFVEDPGEGWRVEERGVKHKAQVNHNGEDKAVCFAPGAPPHIQRERGRASE